MSLNTWKKEYYPATARETAEKARFLPRALRDQILLDHSIQKWSGVNSAAAMRHAVSIDMENMELTDGQERMRLDSSTCALCEHYLFGETDCGDCPLFRKYGARCGQPGTPYETVSKTGHATVLVAALKICLSEVINHGCVRPVRVEKARE